MARLDKPLRPPRHKKPDHAADFTKVIADARAKIARSKTEAFMAQLEAIDTILQDAEPYDVLLLCAQTLARVMPLCCEAHEDEFRTELLRVLRDCLAEERDAAVGEGEGGEDVVPRVH
jgi:hypothetical protein